MLRELLRPHEELAWLEIHWPAELTPESAESLLRQLATDHFVQLAAFELQAGRDRVAYRIGVPASAVARVKALLEALIPDSAITRAKPRPEFASAWSIIVSSAHRPLKPNAQEEVARALLAALSSVSKDEVAAVQWLLGPARPPRSVGSASTAVVDPWWRPLLRGSEPLDPERRQALGAKRSDHAFACVGRVAVAGASPSRTRALAVSVLAGIRIAESPGVTMRLVREPVDRFNRVVVPWRWPSLLNVPELVGLLAWPLGDQLLPGVPRKASRWLRPDPRVRSHRRVLGVATAPGEEIEVGLSIEDARQHLHVIGPTGAGKSNLLGRLILDDVDAGRGVVLVDGKGDLVRELLARIPSARFDDVVVIDPADTGSPVGLNPLLARDRSPELIADQVLAAFHGLYESQWGPRLQVIFHAALLTLAGRGDASLCALPALLTNPTVRRRLLSEVDDPVALEPFWTWFDSLSDAERQQAIAPVLSRLQPLLLRKSLRAIVGQVEPRFRIDEVFTQRKIVLVSLARGLVGPEAAALLGSLFIAELWQAVLERARIRPERRHPVVVYADEFQDYVHLPTDMADALAQARGLGVGLTLAHQHLGQLPSALRSAVVANARSRVCFQVAGDDAQAMAKLSSGVLRPEDFQRLKRYEAYAQLIAGGEMTGFTSIRTLPLPPVTGDPAALLAMSRNRYGRPVAEVDSEIRALIDGDPDEVEPVGRRRRGQA